MLDTVGIVVRQLMLSVNPTDAFAVSNVFFGRVGVGIVQRSRGNIHFIQSTFENLRVFLIS
jgi:hypothetical protein